LRGRTDEDILSICETVKELGLPRAKLMLVTTDGARNVIGKETGFVVGTGKEIGKMDPKVCMAVTLWKNFEV
jgi:hypothetical protein